MWNKQNPYFALFFRLRLYFKQFILVTPGTKYFIENVIRFVLILCPILQKMQTGLQNLPHILVPKLPRCFAKLQWICYSVTITKKRASKKYCKVYWIVMCKFCSWNIKFSFRVLQFRIVQQGLLSVFMTSSRFRWKTKHKIRLIDSYLG